MDKRKKNVMEHYEAFYMMTLSAALLNSAALGEFEADAAAVISLIGKAYGLDGETVRSFSDLILGDMMKIGLVADYHALSSVDDLGDLELMIFYEIKGRALEEANRSNRRAYFRENSRLNQDVHAGMKYESFHHAYDRTVRFESLKQQAAFGDLNSTRQLALFYALGIGTRQNPGKARMHLERCVMWGNVAATVLLKEVCLMERDDDGAKEYGELYRLEKEYLEDGVIRLPEGEKTADTVKERYLCIALIRHYLVVRERMETIDIAFLSVLSQPELTLGMKLKLISRYKDFGWKNAICGVGERGRAGLL